MPAASVAVSHLLTEWFWGQQLKVIESTPSRAFASLPVAIGCSQPTPAAALSCGTPLMAKKKKSCRTTRLQCFMRAFSMTATSSQRIQWAWCCASASPTCSSPGASASAKFSTRLHRQSGEFYRCVLLNRTHRPPIHHPRVTCLQWPRLLCFLLCRSSPSSTCCSRSPARPLSLQIFFRNPLPMQSLLVHYVTRAKQVCCMAPCVAA